MASTSVLAQAHQAAVLGNIPRQALGLTNGRCPLGISRGSAAKPAGLKQWRVQCKATEDENCQRIQQKMANVVVPILSSAIIMSAVAPLAPVPLLQQQHTSSTATYSSLLTPLALADEGDFTRDSYVDLLDNFQKSAEGAEREEPKPQPLTPEARAKQLADLLKKKKEEQAAAAAAKAAAAAEAKAAAEAERAAEEAAKPAFSFFAPEPAPAPAPAPSPAPAAKSTPAPAKKVQPVKEEKKTKRGGLPLFVSQLGVFAAYSGVAALLFVVPDSQWKKAEKVVFEYTEKAKPIVEQAATTALELKEKATPMVAEAIEVAKPAAKQAYEAALPVITKATEKAVEVGAPLVKKGTEKALEAFNEATAKVKSSSGSSSGN